MKACADCGNNPVPHLLVWIDSTMMSFANDAAGGWLCRLIPFSISTRWADAFAYGLVRFLLAIHILKARDDVQLLRNDRARVLRDEAVRRGIPFKALALFGAPLDLFLAEVRGKEILVSGVPRPPSDQGWDFWLDDKSIVKEKLMTAGIPVPKGDAVSTWRSAKKLFEMLEKPLVIKPRLGSRGRHTTTNITTLAAFQRAYASAKQLCHFVVIEEHLIGSVYRCTLVDGKSAGILRGEPPRVTGDGIHTIEQLVASKNALRHTGVREVTLVAVHDEFLKGQGLARTSILKTGQTVDLIEKIGVSYGGHSADDTARTNPQTIRILEEAAKILRDPIIGLDFIIPDIEKSPHDQKWGITECNACPFINLHHDPVEGEPRNVAKVVWDYAEECIADF